MKTSEKSINPNNPFVLKEQDWKVILATWILHKLNNLRELEALQKSTKAKVFFQLPFCLAGIEKWYETHWNEHIIAMEVNKEVEFTKEKIISFLPTLPINHTPIIPDIQDSDFENMVVKVKWEISWWNICQTVISREFSTILEDFSYTMLLTIFNRLLAISGSYMTFMFNSWATTFAWASPEVHLRIKDWTAVKIPIAWTIPKWDSSTFHPRLVDFLDNKKEENELLMVIDEELKMMSRISETWEIKWPLLREIWAVVHTESSLIGKMKDNMSPLEALKETLYSPTLVWWPLESAFGIIKKYEEWSRGYYGWVFWYLDNDTLDTCISIRMAAINNNTWELSVRAWAWIVSDSTPEWEANETIKKAWWFLWILQKSNVYDSFLSKLSPEQQELIEEKLISRQKNLSEFLLKPQTDNLEVPEIKWKEFVIINNEDDFVYLIGNMISRMWWIVKIVRNEDFNSWEFLNSIVVLWPWPWDINDSGNPKMVKLLKITEELESSNRKIIWICLGHQAICKQKWMPVLRQTEITQWVQKTINILGKDQTVWFYNSFSPVTTTTKNPQDCIIDDKLIYQKSDNSVSMQFHPESIMSVNWFDILKDSILNLLNN